MAAVRLQTCPVLTGRAGGLRDEGTTRIHGRGFDLSECAPVSLDHCFAVSKICGPGTDRAGMVSAPVHELHPRSGFPDGLFPLPDIPGLLGSMRLTMPLPDAAAAPAAGKLWHTSLFSWPVVLRQWVLHIRYFLLRQQRLL
jgi:hypothetical protein